MKLVDKIREMHEKDAGIKTDDRIGVAISSVESLRMKDYGDGEKSPPPVFSGIATNATVDLDDEVVVPDGLNWAYALKFGWMYPSHDYEELPIGSLNNVKRQYDGWFFSAVWVRRSQLSKDYYWIAKEFNRMGVSIGFKVKKAGRPTTDEVKLYGPHNHTIREADVLELSPTFMPCNPDAVAHVKSGGPALDGDEARAVAKMVRTGRVSQKTYRLLTAGTKTIILT